MSLSFASPLMLWGAALVAVPLLIHLLNRRRYVVQPFAAMDFLRKAYAQRRRRMRMENLLLLLLRCLVVLLAVLAMALPFVPSDSLLAMVSGGRREVVLVVDRSGSTGRRVSGGATLDARIVETLRRRLSRLSDERGDAVTIITPGSVEMLPAPIGAQPSVALEVLDSGLPPPGGVADMVAAVQVLRERVRPVRPGRLDVEIFTDLQEVSWGENIGELLREVFEQGGGELRIVDVAGDTSAVANVGVESLDAEETRLLAGESITFTATLRNWGERPVHGLTGSFLLDGVQRRKVTGVEVPPRGTQAVSVRLRIDEPGAHHLVFALQPDELPFDDERTLAFELDEQIELLLVDGAHSASRLERSTGYLEMALDPQLEFASGDDVRLAGYTTRVVDTRSFEEAGRDLLRYDAIIFANVGGLTEAATTALEDVVRSGTPLLVFTGDRVVPQLYAERLESVGLLPATVGSMRGDPSGTGEQDYVSLVLPDPRPDSLALFADPSYAFLLQVPVLAWNELTPHENAEVLASFVDALGRTTPAIVRGRLGRGTILLFGTSADDSWSLLPRNPPTWLPLVHELVNSLVAPDPAATNVPVGQAPSLVVTGRPTQARLELPSGAMQEIGRPEVETLGARSLLSLQASPLTEPGPWTLAVEFADSARPSSRIALSALPDAREGDLRRLDGASLERRLAGVDFVMGEPVEEASSDGRSDAGDGSLFRFLLWALLAVVVGESLLSRVVGGRR